MYPPLFPNNNHKYDLPCNYFGYDLPKQLYNNKFELILYKNTDKDGKDKSNNFGGMITLYLPPFPLAQTKIEPFPSRPR